METEFLHKINVPKLLEETGLDISGLASLLDIDEQTINRWSKDKSNNGNRPKYNAIVRMLMKGATTETLFGIKSKPKVELQKINNVRELIGTPIFQEELVKALEELKSRGLIK